MKKKIASLESSLQSARDVVSRVEKELHELNIELKDAMSNMEKELHMLNAKLGWFKFKLRETKCKLDAAKLRASQLEGIIQNHDAEMEFQKEAMTWAEDDATNRGIDAGFKIFKRLLLELHLNFNMKLLEARLSDEVIHKAMDEVEKEKAAA